LGTPLGSCPQVPLLQENPLVWEPPMEIGKLNFVPGQTFEVGETN